jgi:hypothetical protein
MGDLFEGHTLYAKTVGMDSMDFASPSISARERGMAKSVCVFVLSVFLFVLYLVESEITKKLPNFNSVFFLRVFETHRVLLRNHHIVSVNRILLYFFF